MKKTFKTFLTAALLLAGVAASAAITSGYYRIKSYNDNYMTENFNEHTLLCSSLSATTDYSQVWYLTVSGTDVTIKNALTDRYVQKTTGDYWSEKYVTGTSSNTFTLNDEGSGIYTFTDKWSGGPHCDASLNVVLWKTDEAKSKWTIETVTVNNSDLQAQKAALAKATTAQLTQFFTSTACTALNSTYTSYSDANLRSAMSALPTTVQDLAVKIKNKSWTTYSGWDKTEKTFRIADYKAYSSGDIWTDIMGFGYHVGRIENPTGIYVEAGDYLQVYVGDIPSGETVKLAVAGYGAGGYGGTAIQYYTLSEGMNSLYMYTEGNCFVYYEVDNTTNGGEPYKALSNYADVTVHIEGGTVQGYFDLTKASPDTDADWTQFKTHLMSKSMFCLKTKSLVFNLQTDLLKHAVDEATGGSTGKVVDMLNYWQSIQDMEDEIFGRESIATFDYCNNIHSVTTIGNSGDGTLYAYTNGIYFSPEQHDRLFNYDLFHLGNDNLWASAHELGHHRQNPIKMAGHTETSNNIYSNVAVYQQGRYTSRAAGVNAILQDFLDGVSYPERIARANTSGTSGTYNQHMLLLNWQLYMYFHINGVKTDFFPSLFNALRSDKMEKVAGEGKLTAADTDYLKYYVKCCEVSGYDLTDFFAAYGFFMLPPEQTTSITDGSVTTNRYVTFTDYSIYNLYVTQSMIDAAKAEVAAMNLPPCNIIFIEDRVTAPDATYNGASAGEKKQINPDGLPSAFGQVGEMGQYTDFDDSVTPTACSYNVSSRGNVTVSGAEGAVGFIVYDSSGNIIAFANTRTFTLPEGATNYTIKAAAGDGTTVASTLDASIEVQEFPKTGMWYTLSTPLRQSRYVTSAGTETGIVSTETSTPTNTMQWQFVERSGESETFDIINLNDNSYINPSSASNGAQLLTSSSQPSAGWKAQAVGNDGLYIIYSGSAQLHLANWGNSYKILNWGGGSNTSDDGCLFAINEVNELSSTALEELEELQISVSSTAADNLGAGQWYVMFDRGAYHGYLYENVSSHTLYNTNTAPSGTAVDNAKYLVRLEEAPGDGYYYLQDGFGNYFWDFQNSTAVATTGYAVSRIKVDKINGTDGHFYLQCANSNVVLDANDTYSGDATVVGYGTSVTATGGNNDWAFYPVDFTYPVNLNIVGDASYSTLYLDFDVITDEDTKAYYITTASANSATLTEVGNNGHDIPANTAVVLINSAAASSATFAVTSGLPSVIETNSNLLKGTLASMTLDLGSTTPNYSLGVLDDQIGFYKFNDGYTSIITIGANKAYLQTGANTSKGFIFTFDDPTATADVQSSILNPQSDDWYTLDGRKLSGKPTVPGIYINNGKKIMIR